MIGIVIVTHGRLAEELLAAAELIVGKIEGCLAVSISPDEDMDKAEARIGSAIRKVNQRQGALILTDLFGGTPSNLSLTFLEAGQVEVLSGVNLPMLLSLATSRDDKSLIETADVALEAGRNNITLASRILNIKVASRKKEE